ncbi:hypothetical protein HK100_007137 [Physocladia obscura]|uniref:Uncharacterized protein n=1 Tax=Physocladia obscura TaxID=109957 RepID=A0AAD5XK52_9FUNG|nr:hypothetical protein HK100_007137 [Physocladia obscura]
MGDDSKRKDSWSAAIELKKQIAKSTNHTSEKLLVYDKVVFEPWKHSDSFSSFPRVTYFNGHRGCNENLYAVMSRLKLNFNVVNPRNVTHYGMREIDAERLIESGYVERLCDASDVIVIADTLPDARGILLSLVHPDESKRCKSNIVIELTNRFDWMVGNKTEYFDMIETLVDDPPRNLFWTANNPFEAHWMHAQVGKVPKIKLLRSLGAWNVEAFSDAKVNYSEKINSLAIIKNEDIIDRPIIGDILRYYCMPVKVLPKKYGGPKGLLKYKGFIEFPYQVSVMKFYENVAHGVPQIIPTPRFLRIIAQTNNHHLIRPWLDRLITTQLFLSNRTAYSEMNLKKKSKEIDGSIAKLAENYFKDLEKTNPILSRRKVGLAVKPENRRNKNINQKTQPEIDEGPYNAPWTDIVDFYNSEFSPFVYYFDSFAELADLINKPWDEFDYKNVREEGPKYYASVRKQSLATWVSMFHQMGYENIEEYVG